MSQVQVKRKVDVGGTNSSLLWRLPNVSYTPLVKSLRGSGELIEVKRPDILLNTAGEGLFAEMRRFRKHLQILGFLGSNEIRTAYSLALSDHVSAACLPSSKEARTPPLPSLPIRPFVLRLSLSPSLNDGAFFFRRGR